MTDLTRRRHQLRRMLARYRRPLAALSAGGCVLAVLHVLAPPPDPTTPVLVAAHDLPGGRALSSGDVRVTALPAAVVPTAALRSRADALQRTVAGPVSAGEMLTEARLVDGALASRFGAGRVAVPVRVADAEAAELLQVGDRIDVYAATAAGGRAPGVVRDAPVMAIPAPASDPARSEGSLVVLAVTSDDAARLAQEASRAPLTFAMLG